MLDESIPEARRSPDRRRSPTSPFDAFRFRGRRRRPRRREERQGAYFVDRFDAATLAMIVALLGLTIVDGVLTLVLIDINSEEANPIMAQLLNRGAFTFLMGKYAMTASGLPFLVVFKNHPLFRSRFRVGWLLPIFIGLYLILLFHQWRLLRVGRPDALLESLTTPAVIGHAPACLVPLPRSRHDDDPSRGAGAVLAQPGLLRR
jgi:hypothetical protein